VVLVGASGSGKSSWARRHFRSTQVVSSDRCRALVCDDEDEQTVNREAFAVFDTLVRQRLRLGRLTVADSTALEPAARARLRAMADDAGRPACAVLFVVPVEELLRRVAGRLRTVPEGVVRRHAERAARLAESGELEREGFGRVHYLAGAAAAAVPPRIVPPGARPAAPEAGEGRLHG
jgi:predicted kinase